MTILGIDTSSIYASCALMQDDTVKAEAVSLSGLVHSKSVMPLIESVLKQADLDVKDVDVFALNAGPGSFTGVRIGVCAVKGLAQALNKPCYMGNTLDSLKENLPFAECVCPIMDARRGQVYTAVYENGMMTRECDVCLIEDVLEFLKGKKPVFLGDGVKTFKEKIISVLGDNATFAPAQHNFTRAASILPLAKKASEDGKLVSAAALDAIYLRKPQAEREYENRNTVS